MIYRILLLCSAARRASRRANERVGRRRYRHRLVGHQWRHMSQRPGGRRPSCHCDLLVRLLASTGPPPRRWWSRREEDQGGCGRARGRRVHTSCIIIYIVYRARAHSPARALPPPTTTVRRRGGLLSSSSLDTGSPNRRCRRPDLSTEAPAFPGSWNS